MKPKNNFGGAALAKFIALSFGSSLGFTSTVHAATSTWSGSTSGVWDTITTNWSGSTFTSGNDALFTGTPTNNVTAATGLTIGTITLNSGFTGSVALTGNNTVSGATAISGGTLIVNQPGTAVGTVTATNLGTSAVTINSGGQLYVDDEGNGTAAGERILALGNTITGAGTLQARPSTVMTNGWSSVNLTGDLSGFTGTFNVLAGSTINRGKAKFTAASQAAVLSSSATVNVANGAQLYLTQAYNYGFGIHLNGGTGGENFGSLRLDNAALDVTGGVTLHADSIISGAGKISGAIGQSGGTYSLTKVANNTTVLAGPNTYSGTTTISAGTLQLGNGGTTGSLATSGTVTNNSNLTINRSNAVSQGTDFSGSAISGTGSFTQAGSGTTTLSAANTYTGATNVNAGALTITGSLVGTASNAGQINVGQSGNAAKATLNIPSGATITQNGSTNMLIGNGITISTGNGAVYQSGGTVSGMNQLQIGAGASGASYGYYNLSGGTVGLKELDLGSFNGASTGVLDVTSGTMNVSAWLVPSRGASSVGVLNMTGGTLNFTGPVGQFSANWNGGAGSVTVINVANASLIAANADVNLMQTGTAGKLAEINLLTGGTMQAHSIAPFSATGTSLVNFNGGTLKASTATTTFLTTNLTKANVYSGGGTIDNNGVAITIPAVLSAPTGNGVSSISGFTGGSGYVGAPAVTFSGGGGTGASGYATVSGGVITGIVVTNRGTGYTSAPTIALTGGNPTVAAAGFTVNTAANTSGGMTFTGSGTTTLGGANTYTGTTSVIGGSLAITGSLTGPVSVSTAGNLVAGEISPSFTMSTTSVSQLSLSSGGTISFDLDAGSNDQLTVTNPSGLSISGGGVKLYDIGTTNALTLTGTFTLINYTGTLAGSISGLTVANGRVGYAYSFANTGTAITVTVSLTADTDGDGMPDAWEDAHGLNKLVNDADGNPDGDFATNIDEYLASTDPQNAHSDPNNIDDDGLEDNWEISYFGNITAQNGSGDPDGDYATNLAEQAGGTSPVDRIDAPDSDGDGIGDAWEVAKFGNTTTANGTSDTDGDGYSDLDEFIAGTSPTNALQTPADTDSDGLADAWEQSNFGNLTQIGTGDPDGDYATNEQEETASTNPNLRTSAPDADSDGIGDAWEIHYFTNTTTATAVSDFDSDTVTDLNEFLNNSDPTNNKSPYSGTAAMTWATPVTITADTNITTTGTLLHAGNFRSDNTNVAVTVGAETVTFESRQSQDVAGALLAGEEARVIAGSGGRQVNAALFDATGTTVGAAFESVLDGSAWENTDPGPAPGATDMVLRVTGVDGAALITGQQYQIQLFYSDDRAGSSTRGQKFHDNTAGGSASDPVIAGDSKYVIGTFTASSVGYQDIFIQNTTGGANFPVAINAYVLRTAPAVTPDTDSDGMADSWENTYFGNLAQTATGDFDGDGTNNLTEYRLGLTPNNGSSRFAITTADNTLGDGYTITWQGKTGLNFTVERSITLGAGSWTKVTPAPQAGVDGTNSFTDPAPVPAGKAFYRVLLEP
ncbi:MAG: autotransporter-associated beta strand repeat-containing protein [Luteolibacter sp.]|uniref:beta strand repeat-containing protein n=1 Tax=Luteolibacter sp. TaxID=1962973 RepID=UPI0032648201